MVNSGLKQTQSKIIFVHPFHQNFLYLHANSFSFAENEVKMSSKTDTNPFPNDGNELPSNKAQITYFGLLSELKHSISNNDLGKFEKYFKFLTDFNDNQSRDDLSEWSVHTTNPLRLTNLIILCCRFNRTNFLEFLLANGNESYVKAASVNARDNSELLAEKDDEQHNALYYALRNNNIEMVDMIVRHWSDVEIEQLLAETYDELLLVKNMNLSAEMELFVDKKLFDLRFKCEEMQPNAQTRNRNNATDDEIKSQLNLRIDLILDNIAAINYQYSQGTNFDQNLLFLCRALAKDIHILKKKIKSTYSTLPWEEIEFIVIAFVLSHTEQHKINLVYWSVLRNGRFFKHLQTFASKLMAEKPEIIDKHRKLFKTPVDNKNSPISRHIRVEELKQEDADIKHLIEDYEAIRDANTFRKIIDSIDVAVSFQPSDQYGLLVVNRTLQLIGEHLKNTWDSPNLSERSCNLVLIITPKSTQDNLIELRNSLSHSESLLQRTKSADVISESAYLTNVQSDLRKIKKILKFIGDRKDLQIIRQLLTEIMQCKTVDEILEVAKVFNKIKIDYVDLVKTSAVAGKEGNEIRKLVTSLENCIEVKDMHSHALVQQIRNLLDKAERELNLIGDSKFQAFNTIELINKKMLVAPITHDDIKSIKDLVAKTFINMQYSTKYDNLEHIASIVRSLYRHFKLRLAGPDDDAKANDGKVMEILAEISVLCEVDCYQMRCIEDLKYEICHKPSKDTTTQQKTISEHNLLADVLFQKLDVLLNDYKTYELDGWTSYSNSKKLQAAVQMILLDILSLDKFVFISNVAYVYESRPFLMGRDLRNYLAHHHSIIDILPLDADRCVFLNAVKLVQEYNSGSLNEIPKILIGKKVKEDLLSYRQRFSELLQLLRVQNELFVAQQNGQSDEIEKCLLAGADLKARDIHLKTCLHYAAVTDNLEIIDRLLTAGLDLNSKADNDYTPVHVSVESNNFTATKHFLAKCKFNLNEANDKNGQTLLHIAARNCTAAMIRLLLKHNANKKAEYFSYFPLHLSIICKNVEAAKVFIEHLKDGNSLPFSDFTLLHMAAEMRLIELVDILIKKGADIHAKNEKSATVLHMACMGGCHEIVDRIVQSDAQLNVNEANVEGYTALHYASEVGNYKIFEILLSHGANVNATDMFGDIPLHSLCKTGHVEAAKLLLSHGANLNTRNKNSLAPIHLAALHGYSEIVNLLVNNKAMLTLKTSSNLTPLYLAAHKGHLDVVKILIENGAQSGASLFQSKLPTNILLEPVSIASSEGHLDIVDALLSKLKGKVSPEIATHLLEQGALNGHANIVSYFLNLNGKITEKVVKAAAQYVTILDLFLRHITDINVIDEQGFAAIHYASFNGNYEIVKRLIHEHKADINLMTKAVPPMSALSLAIGGNHIAIVKLLLQKGAFPQHNSEMLKAVIELHNLDVIKVLLEKQELSESEWQISLQCAAYLGYVEIFELLLRHANAKTIESQGTTLLCISAMRANKIIKHRYTSQ